jgi:hypothetical protein
MKEWLVRIGGDQFDLQELPALFNLPGATVLEEGGIYFLKSTTFNSLPNADEVLKTAIYLLEVVNGAAILHLENFLPVRFQNTIIGIDQDGKRHSFGFGYGTGRPILKSAQKPAKVASWITKAGQDKNVADALRYLCDQNWVNLYKIFEIVQNDVGDIGKRGWVARKDINRFTQTAQSKETLGDAARHASKKFKPHPQPMSLQEAKHFIRTLLLNWLN